MGKNKRLSDIGYREQVLQAQEFDYTILARPRQFTGHMIGIIRYPKLIYDIGRTVDVRRAGDDDFAFEIRQKRYLGRGAYAISARAKGIIRYDEATQHTQITGYAHIGGQYTVILSLMTLFVTISSSLTFFTILFLPLALLMFAVITLHWTYLLADRNDLQEQVAYLVELTEKAEDSAIDTDESKYYGELHTSASSYN